MADRFFDTSAAAKHYRVETGTAEVDALLAQPGDTHLLSDLSVVELHSVLARLVRTGHITAADFHLARGRFLADIVGGLWQGAGSGACEDTAGDRKIPEGIGTATVTKEG